MTRRLYFTDAGLRAFEATVVACDAQGHDTVVVLDQTAFYPTSGGQPFDTGRIGDARVRDVVDRDDGTIAHIVDQPLDVGARVRGEIDWPRRLDHMQQHTGQHVLSAAFDRLFGVRTVSFHLGAESSTVDLAREVSSKEIQAAEGEANRIVFENRPVSVRFVSDAEAAGLPFRKEPSRTGELRVVEVADFDLSACGGTHVPQTGVIGAIGIAAWERFKGGSRIAFVCGGRLVASHGRLRDVVTAATRQLSVSASDLEGTIGRLLDEGRDRTRLIRNLQESLASYQAQTLREQAETIHGLRVVLREASGSDAAALKTLAAAVVGEPGLVAVLVGDGHPAPVVVARSPDAEVDAGALIKELTSALGGRGGGRPELAQGGVTAEPAAILARAREELARPNG